MSLEATIVEVKDKKPTRKKLALAVEQGQKVVKEMQDLQKLMLAMTPRQRKIFSCFARGMDSAQTAVEIGEHSIFAGIIKGVTLKDGRRIPSKRLNRELLAQVRLDSYERLVSVCDSQFRDAMNGMLPEQFHQDITEYFRIIAPDAFAVMSNIMHGDFHGQKVTPVVALKAATEVLDRAGYEKRGSQAAKTLPVMVNIIMDRAPVAEKIPEVTYFNPNEAIDAPQV